MGFNIMDLMNGATRAAVEGVDNYEAITLNLDEIKVTKHNRYSMDDLEELATSILMDGLQEPLIIGRVNGEYLLSGGHRRREALVILQNEGHTEITQNIPCRFKDMTETQFRLSLLIGNAFYQIVQSDDELDSITKKRRSDIYIKAFNTSVKKIAFNSKKSDGFNPQLVVNDEMEAWPGDQGLKQYEVMTSALGARKQPLIISIATAGYVNDGIFDELFKRATAFLKGNSREKRLLPFIYMIDDIEKWDSIEELKKSNPNLGVSVSAEYYLEQIEIARNSISKKVEFMTKFCNIKQNSAVAWLDYWDVMKCVHEEKPLSLEDFKGCYCVGGIDLSRTTDLTAASIVINRDGINHIFTRFYMPQKRYEVAINEDNTPYNIYRDRGFLFISGENQVDYKDVYNWFIELVKVYKIKPLKIGYDRYSANYLVEDLKTAGFHTDDVYQGTNLTPVLHEFEGNLKDGLFDFGDNSMLAAHFLNVAVDINLNDSRMKPVKIEKRMRIDGAMSVFDALTMVSKYHNEIGKKLLNISKETA